VVFNGFFSEKLQFFPKTFDNRTYNYYNIRNGINKAVNRLKANKKKRKKPKANSSERKTLYRRIFNQ